MQQNIANIYAHLQDDISREVFSNRLLYNLTQDKRYLFNIVKSSCVFDKICEILRKIEKKVIVFGAGEWGRMFYELFHEYTEILFFVDNYRTGEIFDLEIKPVESLLMRENDFVIFVCSWKYHNEQMKQLSDLGFAKEQMMDLLQIMNLEIGQRQYFDLPELWKGAEEIFIDGGAYNGATSLRFKNWCGLNFKKKYIFEPEYLNYLMCLDNAGKKLGTEEFEAYNIGLANEKNTLYFESNKDSSRISQTGGQKIEVDTLDHLVSDKVTFIKLDVEGAECLALEGAKNLIRQYKPKLAISLYHKPEDIWEIPLLILKLNPEYKFYIRHYTLLELETVLYAI